MTRIKPVAGEYYHVFNRGVEKRKIFLDTVDYERFFVYLKEFNCQDPIYSLYRAKQQAVEVKPLRKKKIVEIISYCLNPNHFHLILKQVSENGISEFMKRLGVGYTGYFNSKNKRSGVLFQGSYKSVRIRNNDHLLYLSAYVNDNHFIHGYSDKKDAIWKYSSLLEYLDKKNRNLCSKGVLLEQFRNKNNFFDFVKENSQFMKDKKEYEKYLIE
jgi:REP element-mobilizing transposase RayT